MSKTQRRVALGRKVHDYVAAGVAVTVMLSVVISSTYILMWPIPDRNETLVGQMQGSLWTALGMLVTYYFGSSKSTLDKDNTINSLADSMRRGEKLEDRRHPPMTQEEADEILDRADRHE